MKKCISILLIIALCFSLAGCPVSSEEAKKRAEAEAEKAKDEFIQGTVDYVQGEIDNTVNQITGEVNNAFGQATDKITSLLPDGGEAKSSWKGDLLGCSHEPHDYKKDKNTVVCLCGANTFSNLDYNTFASCVSGWDYLFQNEKRYKVEAFLKYRGFPPVFFELTKKYKIKGDYAAFWKNLEDLSENLNKLNIITTVFVNLTGTADEAFQKADFDNKFGTTLTIVQSVINMHQMVNSKKDPYEACNEFIETVKGPITLLSGATGGANTFTLVGLNSLQFVLSEYKVSMSSHMRGIDYNALALNEEDGAFTKQWVNIEKGKRFWNRKLTYEHIMGTNVNSDLKLPSLPSIVEEYPRLSDQGKAFAGEYILYCLDRVFDETLGITYEEYIEILAQN